MAASDFNPRDDHELSDFSDEELIAYIREARDAGYPDAATRALQILVYGYMAIVEQRVYLRLAPNHVHQVEDVAHDAMVQALAAAFAGTSIGEFRSWLHTITDRTVMDFYRRIYRRPEETLLPSEHLGEEDVWGGEPALEGESEATEAQILADQLLSELRADHRRAVELYIYEGYSAAETAEQIEGMTEANVHQIAKRYRDELRERLKGEEEGDDG